MRVLVTGGHGTMGRALDALHPWPRAVYAGRSWDVRDEGLVTELIAGVRPDVIIHAAAVTDHQCSDMGALIATNIMGTMHVARLALEFGARLVYLSTHYVYSGTMGRYAEESMCFPIGTYAWSKLAGERAVEAILPPDRWLIVRGSWYTHDTRLRHWVEHGAICDAWVSREPVKDSAAKIVRLVNGRATGIYNIGGSRRTFCDILAAEGLTPRRVLTRAEFDAEGHAPYPFPTDVSVSTARYDQWVGHVH